jgi:hypothetical protein
MTSPALFTWQGDGFTPLPRFAKQCDRDFVIGDTYRLAEIEDRSQKTHNHFFAALHEGWLNLPEHLAERFPSAEHLRKWCLIRAGFSDSQTFTCASKAEALRMAAFIRPIDEFSVVTVAEATVSHFTARSQSMRAMGKEEFGRSKQAVLDIIAGMIGVAPAALEHAEAA